MKQIFKFKLTKRILKSIGLGLIVLILISAAAYFIVHKNKPKLISYQGIINKQTCTLKQTGCTGYVLTVNNKQYNVVVPSNTSIQNGTKVTVTSNSLPSSSSNKISTIQATSIVAINSANNSITSNSSTSTTNTIPPTSSTSSPSSAVGHILITIACTNLPAGATCASKPTPFQAAVSVKDNSSGKIITKFISASDGSFSVNLPAGSYDFVPDSYNNNTFTSPSQQVTIVAGQTTNLTINYTGKGP